MNKALIRYILHDATIGLIRNKGGTIASILFVTLATVFLGCYLLVRLFLGNVTDYMNTQLSLKVYVEQGVSTTKVAQVLKQNDQIQSLTIESGDELLGRLSFFFNERQYLLDAFSNGQVNDAIHLELKDNNQMEAMAKILSKTDGIEKVVYPQKMAQILQGILDRMTLYGLTILLVLLVITLLIIYTTFHLALYKRDQELKVKLLVGMNPNALRMQFFFEAMVIALIGSLISVFGTYGLYQTFFIQTHKIFPFLTSLSTQDILLCLGIQVFTSVILCLISSFLATRKRIAHA